MPDASCDDTFWYVLNIFGLRRETLLAEAQGAHKPYCSDYYIQRRTLGRIAAHQSCCLA